MRGRGALLLAWAAWPVLATTCPAAAYVSAMGPCQVSTTVAAFALCLRCASVTCTRFPGCGVSFGAMASTAHPCQLDGLCGNTTEAVMDLVCDDGGYAGTCAPAAPVPGFAVGSGVFPYWAFACTRARKSRASTATSTRTVAPSSGRGAPSAGANALTSNREGLRDGRAVCSAYACRRRRRRGRRPTTCPPRWPTTPALKWPCPLRLAPGPERRQDHRRRAGRRASSVRPHRRRSGPPKVSSGRLVSVRRPCRGTRRAADDCHRRHCRRRQGRSRACVY